VAFTTIDATGPVISARISGELSKSEAGQMQAAALVAIRRCGKTRCGKIVAVSAIIGLRSNSGHCTISILIFAF
jgi:hypothetical protein